METNKKWSLTPVLNPSLPDSPENTETQWGLSFRCPPIPCCWDLKPSHVPGEINIPTICLPAQPNSSCEAPGRWHSETVSGAEHSERKHPKRCNFWGAEINKGNWIFSVPHTWLNPVMPVVTCKQVNCTFIAHSSTGCTSLRHETRRGRLLKHVFNSQEFCDTGMDLSTALSRFHPTAEKVRGLRTLLQGSKLKVQS